MLSALKIRLWIARVKVATTHIALMDYDLLNLIHLTLLLDSKSAYLLYLSYEYNY